VTTVTRPATYDLTALYHEHRLGLVRMAALFVDDLASAEDVVHDAFVAMHRNGHRLRDEQAALAYLRTCVVNAARSVLRRRQTARKYRHRFVEADVPPADTEVLLSEEHRAVLAALRRLPDRQREVLTLRYWSDLSEAQIAETLGVSAGTVKTSASRGMRRLAELMEVNR